MNDIIQILRQHGVHEAEKQMSIIAHHAGDEQLSEIIAKLSPAEACAVIREGDFTKPSIIAPFICVEQLVGAIEHFGSDWSQIKGQGFESLIRKRNSMRDFVLSVVLHSTEKQSLLLKGLVKHPLGYKVLTILPLYEKDCEEFICNISENVLLAQKGTWEELFALLYEFCPEEFLSIQKEIGALLEEEKGPNKSLKPIFSHLKSVLADLRKKAKEQVSKEDVKDKKVPRTYFDI